MSKFCPRELFPGGVFPRRIGTPGRSAPIAACFRAWIDPCLPSKMSPSSARRAFTLIELLVVIALVVVVSAIGWGTMADELPRYRLIRTGRLMRSHLATLQGLAVQTNRETRLRLTASGGDCGDVENWGGAYVLEVGNRDRSSTTWEQLPPDAAEDGTDDDQSMGTMVFSEGGNQQARFVCLQAWSTLTGPAIGNTDAIVFSPQGWVSNPGGDFDSTGYIRLTFVNQMAARRNVNDALTVRISRSGMSRLESTLGKATSEGAAGTTTSSTTP